MSCWVKFRHGTQLELGLDILLAVEEDALGILGIPPGPAGLLDVVFERTGDIRVDHQPDIVLVDPHAEGVGGADDLRLAADEIILDPPFFRRLQPGMKGLDRPALS